ncbi:hypothetical protein [Rufibacter tibetensis]|uniref:Uncharacterized protein n=1 Tax=Rufibacter tibetensis TaxID=512763 RepID=A0A0P0CG73_9BACT|nr:hypothetical protein [Rufibacter tibetensis]ALI98036.1 hypothetical protein DC20_02405 [Rufibacter tibetensis]
MKIEKIYLSFLCVALLWLSACENDEYDGLTDPDPIPAAAITFPQAAEANGVARMEDNAYIIKQNSIGAGQISVQLKVPEGRTIQELTSVTGQRYRNGTPTPPNFSPTVPTAAASLAPNSVTRNTPGNLPTTLTGGPGNVVTYNISTANLPAVLSDAQLPTLAVGDVIRLFFRARVDNSQQEQRAIEVRVYITG